MTNDNTYTINMLNTAQLEGLRVEAGQAGDVAQVDICDRALEGAADARAECARVIHEARLLADDE